MDELHRDEHPISIDSGVVDSNHVRVRQLRHGLAFAQEPGARARRLRQLAAHQLDSNVAAKLRIVSSIDDSHGPTANDCKQPVAAHTLADARVIVAGTVRPSELVEQQATCCARFNVLVDHRCVAHEPPLGDRKKRIFGRTLHGLEFSEKSVSITAMLGTSLPTELGPRTPECLDREARLEAVWQRAVAAWPGIDLDRVAFLPYLAARRPEGASASDWLANAHAGDLYLACACANRIPPAMELFNRAYLSHVGEYLRRIRPDSSFVDDVCQLLREKLFVTVPHKITEYSGRGSLGGWVRVLAVRTAIDLRRRRGERIPDLQAERPSAIDPELGYLAERYRGVVEDAFRRAVTALNGEQRTLLRMHIIDAVTARRNASST